MSLIIYNFSSVALEEISTLHKKNYAFCRNYRHLFHFTGIYLLSKVSLPIVLFGLLTVLLTGEFIECINTNSFNELTETLCSILVKCLEQLTKATGETGYRSRDPLHDN